MWQGVRVFHGMDPIQWRAEGGAGGCDGPGHPAGASNEEVF